MAIIYLRSSAAGADDGSSWTDAYPTLLEAVAAWTTSDIIWMSADSTESYNLSKSLSPTGATEKLPCPVYRVDHTTDIYSPTDIDGSGVTNYAVTGEGGGSTITFSKAMAFFGVKMTASNALAFTGDTAFFEDCTMAWGTENASKVMTISTDARIYIKNCYLNPQNGAYINFSGRTSAVFTGCTFVGLMKTTGLFQPSGSSTQFITCIDCDLTGITNGTILVNTTQMGSNKGIQRCIFNTCKIWSGYTIGDGTMDATNSIIELNGCSDASSTNYINQSLTAWGEQDTSVTAYLTEGFKSYAEDTNLSLVLSPSSACQPHTGAVFSSKISGLVADTGSITFTVELVENFTSALMENKIWLELYYYDSATNTKHAIDTSSREFQQTTFTALSAGSGLAAWTGEPAGSRSVKLEVTVTVNKVGFYYGIVHLGEYESGKVVHINPTLGIS